MNIQRGDIFFVDDYRYSTGSEQYGARPAIVISNDECNRHSEVVEVVFCTTAYKRKLPTHVEVYSTPRISTVLCEQITSVSVERLGEYVGTCDDEEVQMIDSAILVSLGLKKQEDNELQTSDIVMKTELNLYKRLYSELVEKIARKRGADE